MKKPFNNQLATQRLRNEDSVTGGNAPADTAATFKAGDGMQYATKKAFKKKNEIKDVLHVILVLISRSHRTL